jgi:hypothetical protein
MQVPMAYALYNGGYIAVHLFQQDEAVAQVRRTVKAC